MDRSKLTIVFILFVALSSGVFAWWHRYQQSSRVLELWGSRAIVLARDARQVELLGLAEPSEPAETDEAAKLSERVPLEVVQRTDISDARGLIHARHALIDNANFAWDAPNECTPVYEHAIRFTSGDAVATFLLDLDCRRIYLLEADRGATITPFAATALKKYLAALDDQRPRPSNIGRYPSIRPASSPARCAMFAIGPASPVKQNTSQPMRIAMLIESIKNPDDGSIRLRIHT